MPNIYIGKLPLKFMGIFKKKSSDVLDLTKWQETGLLQRSRAIAEADDPPVHESKTVDLTASSSSSTSADNSSDFGFLDSLASVGNTIMPDSSDKKGYESAEHLKVKIEDLEYKLERLKERIDKFEQNSGK